MGDSNYLLHSTRKISDLKYELQLLNIICEILKTLMNDVSFSPDQEIDALSFLNEMYDVRLICLERLKLLMLARLQVVTENQ